MSKPFDLHEQLAAFTGCAPLFPLPNVVHFPHLLLPLHVFEPRYREMVETALEGDRLLAMALLKPGELTTDGSPPIHDTVCLGRITAEQRMPDGRFYVVLQGLTRAGVVQEESPSRPYRVAELELYPETEPSITQAAADAQRVRLIAAFRRMFPHHNLDCILHRAVEDAVPLGILCDVLADALSLDPQLAQQVLAERDVDRRCRLVLRLIREKLRGSAKPQMTDAAWPPTFSAN